MQHSSLMKDRKAVTLAISNTIKLETLHHYELSYCDSRWQFILKPFKLSRLCADTHL